MSRIINFLSSPHCVLLVFTIFGLLFFHHIYFKQGQALQNQLSPEMMHLLDGPCTEDCVENKMLIDHLKTVLVHPSGTSAVLNNKEGIKNVKDQPRQVESILKHFNNKVSLVICVKRILLIQTYVRRKTSLNASVKGLYFCLYLYLCFYLYLCLCWY